MRNSFWVERDKREQGREMCDYLIAIGIKLLLCISCVLEYAFFYVH